MSSLLRVELRYNLELLRRDFGDDCILLEGLEGF